MHSMVQSCLVSNVTRDCVVKNMFTKFVKNALKLLILECL